MTSPAEVYSQRGPTLLLLVMDQMCPPSPISLPDGNMASEAGSRWENFSPAQQEVLDCKLACEDHTHRSHCACAIKLIHFS